MSSKFSNQHMAHVLCVFFYEESIGMGPSVVRTLQGMPIDIVNTNQVESSKWVVNVFKSNVANVLFVSFHAESNGKGPSVVRTLQGIPIGVVNANQVKSSKWVVDVFKLSVANVLCVFFSRGIDWEGSRCCQNALGHAHRRRQRQPGRVQQVGS